MVSVARSVDMKKVSKEKTEFVLEDPTVWRWMGRAPWNAQNPAGGMVARSGGWDSGRFPLGSRDTGFA